MEIGDIVCFQDTQFFNGAVQLGWVLEKPELAREVARAFVFHGPRYHGVDNAEQEGIEGAYRLKDTASFLLDLVRSMQTAASGREVNPYWLAVAGYGSGKSHLSVTIAAILSDPDGETAAQVLEQVHSADADIGAALQEILKSLGKPVLVLPIDGSKGFHLGTALSRVVFAQLDGAGVDADAVRALSPRFETAEQFVERNYAFRADAFSAGMPGRDAAAICAALREQDEDAFDAVNAIYAASNGHPIPVEGQESAQALIETLSKVYCAEDGPFSHVLILFDELGLYLEHAADHPERAGARVLQELFQGVQDNSNRAHFVGFIQYELKSYLKRFASSDLKHLQRYITRFDGAAKWYLSTNLETLFAHMMRKDPRALDALWIRAAPADQCRQTWQRLSLALPDFKRVSVWGDQARFAQVIHQGCWPLHPLAVWFLTRQQGLVQQRSALAFVKDVVEKLKHQPALDGTHLRQVGAADLVLDYMLPELVAAERNGGSTVAETLETLLSRHEASLDRIQRQVLAGIAVLDKTHVGRQTRDAIHGLLSEATALDVPTVSRTLSVLSSLGATEWNADLQRYELLSDGASRAQFEHWIRAKRQAMTADDVRQLFVRRGAVDCPIGDIKPDFDRLHDIRTPDWHFEARPTHSGIIENLVRQSFDEWWKAVLPTDAKGKLIYLYVHEDDDLPEIEKRIDACFAAELERKGIDKAPIWVVYIEDRQGRIADHLARLAILEEHVSAAEQESFRRFIPEEQERCRSALRNLVEDALKEKRFQVAGFSEPPSDRLKVAAGEIFARVYPAALPFPFDGFTTSNGGGARDSIQVARSLMAGSFNYAWIQTQPARLRNRIELVLDQCWQTLSGNGEPCTPKHPDVQALYLALRKAHQEDPTRTLLVSYRKVIAPPYGLTASSAAVLFGLLMASRDPQIAVQSNGQQLSPSNWSEKAFSHRPGRHHFEEMALGAATLSFFDGDVEARWRAFLDEWEAVDRYDEKLRYARKAAEKRTVEPVPPSMAVDFAGLQSKADHAAVKLAEVRHLIDRWHDELQRAQIQASVHHALLYGTRAVQKSRDMKDGSYWPPTLVTECDNLAELARKLVESELSRWIPLQICHSIQNVADFRKRTDEEAGFLSALGFASESAQLAAQASRSIARVEALQRYTLTLATCEDYPRQPQPTTSTPVLMLRNEIKQGDELINALEAIPTHALTTPEKMAHTSAIRQRQAILGDAVSRRQVELGKLDELQIDSETAVREAAVTVERLRQIFSGTKDEEQINDIANLLQRILGDAQSWEASDVSVERLAEIIQDQTIHQLSELRGWLENEDIEPPPQWNLEEIYRALISHRIEKAKRRSADWLRPRLAQEEQVTTLDRSASCSLARELEAAPAYLAADDLNASKRLLEAVQRRIADLEEVERQSQVVNWKAAYLAVHDVSRLDRASTEELIRAMNHPPCSLRVDEEEWQREALTHLTDHLDQLGIDDLVARIERLSQPMREALFNRVSQLMTL